MTFLSIPMTSTANHWKIFYSLSRIIVALIRLLATIPCTLQFIGCASYQFNLAVEQYLEEHKELLGKIHELMKKFFTIEGRAYICTFTHLEPRLCQDTRWSSTFNMVLRYVKFIPLFGKFQTVDITRLEILPLMLSPVDKAR